MQTLLEERVEDIGTQLGGHVGGVVAGQAACGGHCQVIQDEGADHGVDRTGAELLQEGGAWGWYGQVRY